MAACSLIFPHQLFDPHPALAKSRPVFFIEDSLFFGDPHVGLKFHQQKIVLHRASMKSFADVLGRRGFHVHYLDFCPNQTISHHLTAIASQGFDAIHLCDPADFLLEKRLRRSAATLGIALHISPTPMFLTPPDVLAEEFGNHPRPHMARFYQRQRQRLNLLLDPGGGPQGGKWSLDTENRKPMPKSGLHVPPDPSAHTSEFSNKAIKHTLQHFPHYHGQAAPFAYPTSHAQAEQWLDSFLAERLHLFGDYEDAMGHRERVLFHSILTPALNIGLLTPDKIIARTLDFHNDHPVPLNSLEGFIRQIVGWREFIYGAYLHRGVESRNGNFWGFEDKPIPRAFYDASTGIPPVDLTIRRVLEHGWCHHIERLMVLGNFMLLCGFHPHRVYAWFMELFIDAYDWVMVPNVYGMSQFADGGTFATKPYISGSNYIRKMGDFTTGAWCATWDALFWTFISNHQTFFRSHPRLSMMARQLEKMPPAKLHSHHQNATNFRASLS